MGPVACLVNCSLNVGECLAISGDYSELNHTECDLMIHLFVT